MPNGLHGDYRHALWPNRDEGVIGSDRATQILDLAAREFYAKGYAPTTMQHIADEAGVLKGSIYHHFTSKEEMLYLILDAVHLGLAEMIGPITQGTRQPLEKLRAILVAHTIFNARNLEWTTVFYNDFRALSPERCAKIIARRDEYDQMLLNLIVDAQRQGELRAGLSTKLALFGMTGLVNSIHRWYRADGLESPESVAESFGSMIIDGVKATPDA